MSPSLKPAWAARVHLDVLHFHPFADGNARSAALALYFVLAREAVVLGRAAPLPMSDHAISVVAAEAACCVDATSYGARRLRRLPGAG
jgi:prophage maintenance system killer protein